MKYKSYPEYKETEIECIAEIPKHWVLIKLKYILSTLQSGKRENLEIKDNDAAFSIGGEHLNNNGSLKLNKVRLISKEFYNSMNSGKIQNGDILLVKDGATIGKTALISKKPYKNMAVNEHVFILRPNNKINSLFLYYLISGVDGFEQIKLTETGSAQGGINTGFTDKVWFSMPEDKNEIDFISNFLDKKNDEIDKLIKKDKKLIGLLQERRTAFINHVVTKGLNPNARMKDSGIEWIGKIPEDWKVCRLKYIVTKINSGITPSGGSRIYTEKGIPLLRSQNIHFNGLQLNNVAYIPYDIHISMVNSVVQIHDVLINITGASIGRCTYVENEFRKANVNQHVCIIRPMKIFYKYLSYYLMSKLGQDQVSTNQMGTSREGLNFEQLSNFMILCPKIEQQKTIVRYIEKQTSKIDNTIKKIQQKINLLEEYKKSLIHHVVTGKVDVRSVKV